MKTEWMTSKTVLAIMLVFVTGMWGWSKYDQYLFIQYIDPGAYIRWQHDKMMIKQILKDPDNYNLFEVYTDLHGVMRYKDKSMAGVPVEIPVPTLDLRDKMQSVETWSVIDQSVPHLVFTTRLSECVMAIEDVTGMSILTGIVKPNRQYIFLDKPISFSDLIFENEVLVAKYNNVDADDRYLLVAGEVVEEDKSDLISDIRHIAIVQRRQKSTLKDSAFLRPVVTTCELGNHYCAYALNDKKERVGSKIIPVNGKLVLDADTVWYEIIEWPKAESTSLIEVGGTDDE